MKILIIDFQTILDDINQANLTTKTFEIYSDISRMLEIDISKEACFKLFTRYINNYGKLRDYLCILGNHVDKKKFDDEFYRRYKQIYFNQENSIFDEKKKELLAVLDTLSKTYITSIIAIGNSEFVKTGLVSLDLGKYLNSLKMSEYRNEYICFSNDILQENVIESNLPQKVVFVLPNHQEDLKMQIQNDPHIKKYSIEFSDLHSIL